MILRHLFHAHFSLVRLSLAFRASAWSNERCPQVRFCAENTGEAMELEFCLRVVRRRWPSILAAVVLGLALALGIVLVRTPLYTANSHLFVSVNTSVPAADVARSNAFAEKRAASYVSLATSAKVLGAVAKELDLSGGAQALVGKVTATRPEETVIIILTATDPDPNQAAKIANLSAKQLISAVDGVEDVSLVRLSVFEEASAPSFPSSPVLPANLALGGLLGLLVGFGYVFFRQALDRGIRGQADVEPVVGARILGAVAFDPSVENQLEVVQRDAFSSRAESLRQLRTQLRFTNTAGGSQTVVVSSSIAGEGKTSIAVNLAIMFAESGTRVLLIDADLRCPQIANILGIDGSVGLSDVLSDSVALADAVQESGHDEAFHVLASGGPVPNPSKLLGSPTMEKLIERAETDYAVVLIDTPPLLPVADPAIIAAKTSGVVLVVSADGRTTQEDVTQAVATLNAINTSFLGVVVNKAGRTERPRGGRSIAHGTHRLQPRKGFFIHHS